MAQQSDCATGMQAPLRCNVDGVSLFCCIESAKVKRFAQILDASSPLPFLWIERGAHEAGCAASHGAPQVLHVGLWRNISQVCNRIVQRVAVDVVNVIHGPLSSVMQPRKSVSVKAHTMKANGDVSIAHYTAGNRPSNPTRWAVNSPFEDASFRGVIKKFAHSLRGKIHSSHEALQLPIGQKPQRVPARLGLRHFSAEQ